MGSGSGGRQRKRPRCERRRAVWVANPDVVPGSAKPNSEQRFAYRTSVTVEKPVERAVLFATGEDTVVAWVNGEQVMTAAAYPPYHHLPWKKFVRADVTAQMAQGRNTIAIESVHYIDKYGEDEAEGCAADDCDIGAALQGWDRRRSLGAMGRGKAPSAPVQSGLGEERDFDDSRWKNAMVWVQAKGPEESRCCSRGFPTA